MNFSYRDYLFRLWYILITAKCLKKEYFEGRKLNIDFDDSIIFLLACDYNNVGDYLIRNAQIDFIKNVCPGKKIEVIGHNDTFRYLKYIKDNITKNTLVVLTGGGNIDDKYISTEIARNQIIKQLRTKNCKIISFPQTVSYDKNARGRYCLKKTRRAFAKNDNFVLFAREKVSFRFAKRNFLKTKVLLVPDIVLSFKKDFGQCNRSGIGLLMRNDAEKVLEKQFVNEMINELKRSHDICDSDMSVNEFDKHKLQKYMDEKVAFVKSKELVITDRLHGMILCYITNTPCIVFTNSNHKILETYNNWLKNKQNFIVLETGYDINNVMSDINELLLLKSVKKSDLFGHFVALKNEVVSEVEDNT